MEVRIQAIHFDATEKLQDFIQKKTAKLEKYCDDINKVEVSLKANHGSHMHKNEVTPQMASFFYSHFRGRKDVYSVRSRPKDGKTGCFPVCDPICPPRGQFGAL